MRTSTEHGLLGVNIAKVSCPHVKVTVQATLGDVAVAHVECLVCRHDHDGEDWRAVLHHSQATVAVHDQSVDVDEMRNRVPKRALALVERRCSEWTA